MIKKKGSDINILDKVALIVEAIKEKGLTDNRVQLMMELYWGGRSSFEVLEDGIYCEDADQIYTWEDEYAFLLNEVDEDVINNAYEIAIKILGTEKKSSDMSAIDFNGDPVIECDWVRIYTDDLEGVVENVDKDNLITVRLFVDGAPTELWYDDAGNWKKVNKNESSFSMKKSYVTIKEADLDQWLLETVTDYNRGFINDNLMLKRLQEIGEEFGETSSGVAERYNKYLAYVDDRQADFSDYKVLKFIVDGTAFDEWIKESSKTGLSKKAYFDGDEEYPSSGTGKESSDNEVRDYIQWMSSNNREFFPASKNAKVLVPGFYEICETMSGSLFYKKIPLNTEALINFPETNTNDIINEIETFWDRESMFREAGLAFKRGILMYGPPGSGKTSAVKMILSNIIKRGGVIVKFGSPYSFSSGMKILREIQADTPVVCLMEDLDSILAYNSESSVINVIDGMEGFDKIVFLATTNYPEKLGSRIMNRPSRFDKRVFVGMPNSESRKMYLDAKLGGSDLSSHIPKWVEDTEGFSTAHLKEMVIAITILGKDYDETLERLRSMAECVDSKSWDNFGSGKAGMSYQASLLEMKKDAMKKEAVPVTDLEDKIIMAKDKVELILEDHDDVKYGQQMNEWLSWANNWLEDVDRSPDSAMYAAALANEASITAGPFAQASTTALDASSSAYMAAYYSNDGANRNIEQLVEMGSTGPKLKVGQVYADNIDPEKKTFEITKVDSHRLSNGVMYSIHYLDGSKDDVYANTSLLIDAIKAGDIVLVDTKVQASDQTALNLLYEALTDGSITLSDATEKLKELDSSLFDLDFLMDLEAKQIDRDDLIQALEDVMNKSQSHKEATTEVKFKKGDIVFYDNTFLLILSVGEQYYNTFDLLNYPYNDNYIDIQELEFGQAKLTDIEGAKEFLQNMDDDPSKIDRALEAAEIYEGKIWEKEAAMDKSSAIKVYHNPKPSFDSDVTIADVDKYTLVATVATDNLDEAYDLTQNKRGSWSKGESYEWEGMTVENADYSPAINVETELPIQSGKLYGLRSTSMGDILELNGKFYVVDVIGFEELGSNIVEPKEIIVQEVEATIKQASVEEDKPNPKVTKEVLNGYYQILEKFASVEDMDSMFDTEDVLGMVVVSAQEEFAAEHDLTVDEIDYAINYKEHHCIACGKELIGFEYFGDDGKCNDCTTDPVKGNLSSKVRNVKQEMIDGLVKREDNAFAKIAKGIPGGKADGQPDDKYDKKQIEMGMEIEKEHTDDPDIAKDISKDHLEEIPDYYTRLDKMEKEYEDMLKKNKEGSLQKIPGGLANPVREGSALAKLYARAWDRANKKVGTVKQADDSGWITDDELLEKAPVPNNQISHFYELLDGESQDRIVSTMNDFLESINSPVRVLDWKDETDYISWKIATNKQAFYKRAVICSECGEEMMAEDTESCTYDVITIDGEDYNRDTSYNDEGERCHDCNILNGDSNVHHFGCDIERCPKCGGQLLSCECNKEGLKSTATGEVIKFSSMNKGKKFPKDSYRLSDGRIAVPYTFKDGNKWKEDLEYMDDIKFEQEFGYKHAMNKKADMEVVLFDAEGKEIDWYDTVSEEPTVVDEDLVIEHDNGTVYTVPVNKFDRFEWREKSNIESSNKQAGGWIAVNDLKIGGQYYVYEETAPGQYSDEGMLVTILDVIPDDDEGWVTVKVSYGPGELDEYYVEDFVQLFKQSDKKTKAEYEPYTGGAGPSKGKKMSAIEGYSQICVWPGTVVGVDKAEEFETFMQENFDVKVKYLEEVETNPDLDKDGDPVTDTGGRNDLFFAVADDDVHKFSVPRLQYGIRWLEDVVKYNDGAYLYSQEILDKYPVTW